jgi:thioredoxin reductase (NADPH)
MVHRAQSNPKIEFLLSHKVVSVDGGDGVERVRVHDLKTAAERTIESAGLFFAIGHVPNTSFLGGQIDCDEQGYILTVAGTTQTNVPGVFAAGDCQDKKYRQAITAAGTGCMAALEAEHFLATHH